MNSFEPWSWQRAWDILVLPVTRLFETGDALALVWLLSSLAFLFAVIVLSRVRRRRLVPLRAILRFALPRRILLHPSSLLDYRLFAANTIMMAAFLSLFILGAPWWNAWTAAALEAAFGPPAVASGPSWTVCIVTALAQLLALDFGYWLAHYWFHESPTMWEFHKVHHSAEVMTPATEWRQHPVELVAFPIVYGFTSGVTYAVASYVFGPEAQQFGLTGQNMIIVAHLATFHHLRHSHVHMPFTGVWGKLFHSPAHHQIHHADNPAYYGKNLGFMLSIWDWMFGRLQMPKHAEKLVLGIGPEGNEHTTVRHVLIDPFRKAWQHLKPSRRPDSANVPAE